MDTKSRNIDEENVDFEDIVKDFKRIKRFKIIAIIIMLMMISVSLISFRDIKGNRYILDSKDLYSSKFLGSEINAFTGEVLKLSELYKTEEYIKDGNNLLEEEIASKKESINSKIQSEYEVQRNKLYENSGTLSEEELKKKQDALYKEIEEKYSYKDEELKKLITEQKLKDFNINSNVLNNYKNLKFVAYDKGNNIWLTNYETGSEAIEKLKEDSRYFAEYHISGEVQSKKVLINGEQIKDSELLKHGYYYERYGYVLKDNSDEYVTEVNNYGYENGYSGKIKSDLDVYISVPKELVAGDSVYNTYESFLVANNIIKWELVIFIGAIVGIAIMAYVLKKFKYKLHYADKIVEKLKEMVLEVKILGLFIGYILYEIFFKYNWTVLSNGNSNYVNNITFNNVAVVSIILAIYYLIIKALILNHKDGTILKDSYVVKLYNYLKIAMGKGSFGRKLFWTIGLYVLICIIVSLGLIITMQDAGAFIALLFDIVATAIVIFTLVKDFAYLNKITIDARRIYEGKINDDIAEEGNGALRDLAHSINNMKRGLRKSIENENKSERMKTELISNVSHDLKTPLTSIISYVDLLKRAEVEPEEARAYIEVLEKKAQRLKILIEDLFEASKAASGSMQLNFEKIEVNALLKQTLGEAEKKIEEAQLDFKTNIPQEKIYINADGRKIWRVFENLVSNTVKYALKGTRVYLDVKSDDEKVYIVIKNVSAYELNFDSSEITERFKRGEESRHTEGSGLGLAIAKSIIELHGGTLTISIDGDLFKVTVELKTIDN